MPDRPKPATDEKGRFLPGNNGGGGRPKGSRNKLGEAFTCALYADFQEHGPSVIARVREGDPAAYLRIVAGLLPREVKVDRSPVDELSDEELEGMIELLRAA